MIEIIQDRILKAVNEWIPDLQSLANRNDIIAINFRAQMVHDGFELYLSGHTWYDDHDLWLLDEKWSPTNNYISLGKESLEFNRLKILEEYEYVLKREIANSRYVYEDIVVFIGLADGEIKRIN